MVAEFFAHYSNHLDEITSNTQVLTSQLSDSVVFPLTKLIEADLQEVAAHEEEFTSSNAGNCFLSI